MSSAVANVTPEEARRLLEAAKPGEITVLDVRQEPEYAEFRLPGATLAPLPELAERLDGIDRDKPVLAYCRSGRRSAVAADFLVGKGFSRVMNLLGGALAWQGAGATGPPMAGLGLLSSEAAPGVTLALALALEMRLGAWYGGLAETSGDPELAATWRQLAGFEEKHANRVRGLIRRMKLDEPDAATLARIVPEGLVEGGRAGSDYAVERGGGPESVVEVLELAMAVEAQAMDLYVRLAARAADHDSRGVLERLSNEEKGHLKALGALLSGRAKP